MSPRMSLPSQLHGPWLTIFLRASIRLRVPGPLVDLQRIDFPESLPESGGVVGYKVGAASPRSAAARAPDVAGPVAAESRVEDLVLISMFLTTSGRDGRERENTIC